MSWTGFAFAAIHLMIILTALYAGDAVARKFGCPQHWGTVAALALVALVNMVLLLVRELPRQGLPFLWRWFMFCVWLAAWLGITWSAMQVGYDDWCVFYASTHVLLVLMLTLLVGWVCAGQALAAIVFDRPASAKGNASSGVDDPWLD